MARPKLVGAETGDLSEIVSTSGTFAVDGTTFNDASGKGGAYAFKATGASVQSVILSGLNVARAYYKTYFFFDTDTAPATNAAYVLAQFQDSGGTPLGQISVVQLTDGSFILQILNSSFSPVVGPAITIAKNTWYRFEIDFAKGAGTGAATVYQDGISVATGSSAQFGANNIDRVLVGSDSFVLARSFWFDDIEVDDAALPGVSYVIARSPNAGTPTYDAWDKSTGTDASALLNDTPFTSTDFVRSALASVAQSVLIGSFSATQSGHGNGTIQSYDTLNALKAALVAKTAATTATGITEVGTAQSGSSTGGANITLTFSVAPQAGDTVLVFGGFGTAGANNPGISTSGYSNQFADNATATRRFGVWSKVMGATPDTTVVCLGSGSAGDGVAYAAIVLRQIDNNVILDVAVASASGSSTNPNPPASGATVTANTWVLSAAASAVNDTSKGTQTSYTQEADASANATRPYSVALSHRLIAASGTNEDPAAWSSWSTGAWRAVTVTIRPAVDAGSAAKIRRRLGGADTDTAITLTTSDAYYETAAFTDTLTNLNAGEMGVLHGNNSLTQTLEDEWMMASYTPGIAPSIVPADVVITRQSVNRAALW